MPQEQPEPGPPPGRAARVAWRRALPWALFWASAVAFLLFCWLFTRQLIVRTPPGSVAGFLVGALARCAAVLAALVPPLLLMRLVWLSRALTDRAFTVAGFLATFFGLAVLVLFVTALARDTARFLLSTPRFVQAQPQPAGPTGGRDTSPPARLAEFLARGQSLQPREAGIRPALLGSLWAAVLTLIAAVPVGVGAALYLEEYGGRTWLGRLLRFNIANLAAVPPVLYGVLGAALFGGLFLQPVGREPPAGTLLAGGFTLGLLTLPLVIVAAQEALRAVPRSVREGAYALGATRWQVISRNVLPMAAPGIGAGTILALSRAVGEAAPLVVLGAYLTADRDPGLFSPFTVLPLQVFDWADRPPVPGPDGRPVPAWQHNAAAAGVVLLLGILALNAAAAVVRERRRAAGPERDG